MGIHSLSDVRDRSIDSPWISVFEQTSSHCHAFIQSWHGQSPCSYVIIAINITIIVTIAIIRIRVRKHISRMIWMRRNYWSRLEICKYVKFANTSNLQICKLSWCLSASQSSNRAAKWLHVDSSTERKWERYSIALCFCLFLIFEIWIGHFLLFLSVVSLFATFLLPKSSLLQSSRHSFSFHHLSVNGMMKISAQLFILTLLSLLFNFGQNIHNH